MTTTPGAPRAADRQKRRQKLSPAQLPAWWRALPRWEQELRLVLLAYRFHPMRRTPELDGTESEAEVEDLVEEILD